MRDNSCFVVADPRLVGDPVDTLTGALLERKLEFRLIGPLELRWWRHYDSSQVGQRFALGWGHTHDLDRILYIGDDKIIYGSPVGLQAWFPLLDANGAEAAAQGFTLKRQSPVRYEVHRHGEPAMEFIFAPGTRRARPSRLFSDAGEIRLFHDQRNRLERVVHSTGVVLVATQTEAGLLAELTLEQAGGRRELLLAYAYDDCGNLVRTRDGRRHGYELTYDEANRLIRRRGRKGFTFRYKYDEAGRCVFSAGNDNWYGVALTYDLTNRQTSVRRPDGGVWTYTFMPGGKLFQITDPLGGVRKFLYDLFGRSTHEVDPLGNITEYGFDAAGARVRKILPTGQVVPLPESPSAPNPLTEPVAATAAQYHFGHLIETAEALPPSVAELSDLTIPPYAKTSATTRADPDLVAKGQTQYCVMPLGAAWWPAPARGRVFSELGKLIDQYDDNGRRRRWSYDASGNLESYSDFDGRTWCYDYGTWHLLRAMTTPVGATTRLTYTTNERVATCRDPSGTLSEYGYDQADQLIEVRRHGVVRETYTRDPAGNFVEKLGADGRLLLKREIGPGNLPTRRLLACGDEHSFVRDRFGRCIVATTKQDSITRGYGPTGKLDADLRNGKGLVFHRNGLGEPVDAIWFDQFTVRLDSSEVADCLTLTDPAGRQHRVRRPGHGFVVVDFANGTQEVCQFDERGRCLFKALRRANGTRWIRRYQWSGEGELSRVEDSLSGEIEHGYDPAHRLSSRRISGRIEQYVQDAADNLIAQPGLSGVTLQEGNRLLSANGMSIEYNDRNHIARWAGPAGTNEFFYNSCDLLIRAVTPSGFWMAEYDALGRRTRKTWNGRTTEFYWFGNQLIAESGPEGNVRLYIYPDPLALTPIFIVDYESADEPPENGRVGVVIADQLGTPVLVEGARGEPLWQARIAPFGAAEIAPGSRITFGLRFPGHYDDAELGLHYNRYRHYSPVLGRYLQSDPWGTYGGTNLYAYRSNPLLSADVRGRGEEGTCSKNQPPEDEEGAGPKTQPGGEEGGSGQKALKDMTPDELKAHVEQRADDLKQAFKAADPEGEKRTTLSVGVVEKGGDPETRRVVVSTSADDQRLPPSVKDAMLPGEQPIQGEPFFVREPNPNHDPNQPTGRDNPKTQVHEVDMNTGQTNPEPYQKAQRGDPPSGTEHHAEQRMGTGAAENGEHVLAQQPTKPCCPGCTKVLGDNGSLSNIPNP